MKAKDVLTFIMAGGKGERLYPLTKDRAKPAVPFGGIYRIIDFTLSNCVNSGLRRIHVLTQYKSHSLARHIRMGWNIFDSQLGEFIDVIPAQQRVDEHWYQGTADSIYQNIYTIEIENPKFILILAGDHVYKMNYMEMLSYHIEKNADLTIGVVEINRDKARHLGIVTSDSEGQVTNFAEKPNAIEEAQTTTVHPKPCLASMGIYIFNKDALEHELKEDAPKNTSHDFARDIIPNMLDRRRVFTYNFKDENKKAAKYWRDIGTIDAYYEANMDLVQVTPIFNLYDKDWPIRTYHEQCPPAKTVFADEVGGRMGMAVDSLIANGCIISGGRVQASILSPFVRINSYAEVWDSVLMEGVTVDRHARIRRAIVDKDVTISEGMQIGYDLEQDKKRFTVTESGIIAVAKGMTV